MLRDPLKIFDSRRDNEKEINLYKGIIVKFKELISKWKEFRSVRSIIEELIPKPILFSIIKSFRNNFHDPNP